MRFQVPQFIEVEDRLFGPLTFSQFIYLAGGFGFLGGMILLLPFWAALIVGGPIAGLGAALAFIKVNERPLILTIEHAFEYYIKDKLYIWDKTKRAPTPADDGEDPARFVADATGSKIKDLAWSLDVKESIYAETTDAKRGTL